MSSGFEISSIKNKNILIKTFIFESGLWYLAKSLGDILSKNNNVFYIPKARYVNNGGRFTRTYPDPNTLSDFSDIIFEKFDTKLSVEHQVSKSIEKYGADLIISFETLMENGQWVMKCKSKYDIDIFDIPMPEWVTKRFVNSRSYRIFDKVLCLTGQCKDVFKSYDNAHLAGWKYIDEEFVEKNDSSITFYHPGSLNSNFSTKNTNNVIRAFISFLKLKDFEVPVKLIVTGGLSEQLAAQCNDIDNILIINNYIDRQGVFDILKKTNCLIAPSRREGLGLSFFEAKAFGCSIITTDYPPMSEHGDYLCKASGLTKDEKIIPLVNIEPESILVELKKYYEEFIMAKKSKATAKEVNVKPKKKLQADVNKDNKDLLSAFSGTVDASGAVNAETEVETEAEVETEVEMNNAVLEKLKSRMNRETSIGGVELPSVIDERIVSINMAVIGVGQAGSRLAEEFYASGYDVGVINTSAQDLEFISVTPAQKLLVEGSLGGTGKDLDLGRDLFSENESLVQSFVSGVVDGNDMAYLAVSGGGGTGSSSVDALVPMLFNLGVPVGVIYVLPKATEDAKSKKNSIETLSRLAKMTSDNLVSNLIVVDNARIEQIYANLSQSQFWKAANKAIIEPLHLFNTLTASASDHTSMDPSDFGKIISCGDCSIYGVMEVDNYMEETALAEAVIDSLSTSMLAEGFDVSQTRVGGVIITGPAEALDKMPALNINYCFHMISEQTNGASIFQGIYSSGSTADGNKDSVKIYSWFAGLGLPKDRVDSLKRESAMQSEIAAEKERNRASAMVLDLGEDKTNSVAEEVNRKIKKKKSGFNKLQRTSRSSIIDKRRRR
jgi:cell division GTPase FtsZ/glycosyltransferase involved in cell wall biosynthesis